MKTNCTIEIKKITPEIASDWLAEKWGEQRNIRSGHVNRLAADMTAGRFVVSCDAILRIRGRLANGQHRLCAVVQSGKPQWFIVMESNDEDLYKVIDSGLRRTVSDGLRGIQFCKSIPPIARWVQAYNSGGNIRASAKTGSEATSNGTHFPTQCELIDYCIGNQELFSAAAAYTNPLYDKTKLLPASIGGAIYAIASGHGKVDEAKRFLQAVYVDGGNNAAGDLRNRLIANKGSKARLTNGYLFAIALKSFRSFANGTRAGVLKWSKEETLPSID